MYWKVIYSSLMLIALAACYPGLLPPSNVSPGEPTTDPQLLIGQAVTQTFGAQTQIAQAVQQTMAAMVTETPSLTPSPSFTFTPEIARVTVSVQTNCRTGPGVVYDILGVLPVGQSAEVIGRNASGDTWVIRLPSNPAIICWLWGQNATVSGNITGLTIYTPPPTPTPAPGFTVSYLQTVTCAGMYAFRFQLVNNGGVTWKSNRVEVNDLTSATTKSFTDDYFTDYTGCGPFANQYSDLEPGESGVTGNWSTGLLNYNPAGHNITATFTLCSQDGMAGICTSKSISFTP